MEVPSALMQVRNSERVLMHGLRFRVVGSSFLKRNLRLGYGNLRLRVGSLSLVKLGLSPDLADFRLYFLQGCLLSLVSQGLVLLLLWVGLVRQCSQLFYNLRWERAVFENGQRNLGVFLHVWRKDWHHFLK